MTYILYIKKIFFVILIIIFIIFVVVIVKRIGNKFRSENSPSSPISTPLSPIISAKTTKNIFYSNDSELNRLDIYSPENADDNPVLIYIHGGSLQAGDKEMNLGEKKDFFVKNGFVFVSINYRLSSKENDIKYPTHLNDAITAVNWIYDNIKSYGGSRENIYILGFSGGAHLAASVMAKMDDVAVKKINPKIKGFVLLDGIMYDIKMIKDAKPVLFSMLYKLPFGNSDETLKKASPTTYITSGKNIAKSLIFYTDKDLDDVESKLLYKKLIDNGYYSELVYVPNITHEEISTNIGKIDDAVTKKIVEFLSSS